MFDWHGLSFIVKTEINKHRKKKNNAKVKKEMLCFYSLVKMHISFFFYSSERNLSRKEKNNNLEKLKKKKWRFLSVNNKGKSHLASDVLV